jgi:phosphoserine phosphatase RsbU/P
MPELERIGRNTWRVSPDPMCILGRDGCFVAVNPAWFPTLGWTELELVGRPFLDLLHGDDVERSIAAFEEVKSGKPVLRFENRYRTKEGWFRWFSWVAVPEGDYFYCVVRDVTDDKKREQTIDAQRNEAELREQFLAVLGHDLRNPLAAIIAGISLLMRENQSERSVLVLQHMQASGMRMTELITNMMDFARVRLGDGIGLERASIPDFAVRVSDIVQEIQSAFSGARIDLKTDIEGDVYCDGPRTMQVISNLLGNAVTHGAADQPITVDVVFSDCRLTITVCNKGTPIPQETLKTLFQPFFKGDPHSSPHGLGLGLYISSEIVSAHGGEINVSSDDGTICFEVDMPACKPPQTVGRTP